jgi:hypothetical protein
VHPDHLARGRIRFDAAATFLWTMVLLTIVIDRVSRRMQMRRLRC